MSGVRHIKVGPEDDGQRLDRWLKKCVPELPYGLAQKLIRKGAIRIDGKKSKTDTRLSAGQEIRIPPIEDKPEKQKRERVFTDEERDYINALVLYDDGDIIVFNKPTGLASQGGGGVEHHIDAYFPLLEKNEMVPRLIHRLDRDTSGILLAARSPDAVRRIGKNFKDRRVRKIYLAVTKGVPEQNDGTVRAPLSKASGQYKDKMIIDDDGKFAETDFAVLDKLGKEAAFLAFWPRTGRTHQIRVHAADILGCPVLGDEKYGGKPGEELEGMDTAGRLHLHAYRLQVQHPSDNNKMLDFTAPLPPELQQSWRVLGFDPAYNMEPFDEER